MTDDEIRDTFAELHRLGYDFERPPGLALGTGFRDGEFLRWLRALPDGLGHDAFVERVTHHVAASRPNAAPVVEDDPARRPHRLWPTVEQLNAGIDVLQREWDPLGARLGELSRESVMHHAFNALQVGLSRQSPMGIERRIATHLSAVEEQVFGVRSSPREQRRYLARRLIQVVADDPGPEHEHDPIDAMQRATTIQARADVASGRRTEPHAANRSSATVHMGTRGDEPPALDPHAHCTECGTIGTVAVVMREVDPLVSRYCVACWMPVRHKYLFPFGRRDKPEDAETPEAMIAGLERHYDEMLVQAFEQPRYASSALWEDSLEYVSALADTHADTPDAGRDQHRQHLARALVARAPQMYGPMPPAIEAFVDRYGGPDA